MKYHEALDVATKHFLAQWGTRTLVTLENEVAKEPGPTVKWVRFSATETGGGGETLGAEGTRRYWRRATALIQVYTEMNKGVAGGALLATQARDIFEGRTVNGLYFYDARIRSSYPDGKFHQTLVEAFFNYEETK